MLEHFEYMEVLTSKRMNMIVDAINGITGTLYAEYSGGRIKKVGSEEILTYDDLRGTLNKGNLVILKYDNAVLIPAFLKSDSGIDAIAFHSTYNLGEVTNLKLVVNSLNEIVTDSVDLANLNIVTSVTSEFSESRSYSEGEFTKYEGQLIRFVTTHESGSLSEDEYEVINLDTLASKLNELTEYIDPIFSIIDESLNELESRVTNIENNGYSVSATSWDSVDEESGRVTPKGSSRDSEGNVVGLSSNRSIYRRTYSDLFKVIQIANITNEDTFNFTVNSRYFKYSGFIKIGLSGGEIAYAYTDSPEIAKNFMILNNSGIAIRVGGAGLEITLETASDIPLTNYIVDKDDFEVRYIESLYESDDIVGNLVEVPEQVYVFNGHHNFEDGTDGVDTGYLREFDGVIFTGTSPVRKIVDISPVADLDYIESWRLYNNSEVPLTWVEITFNGDQVIHITEEVPINAYLEVTKVGDVWDAILILPPEDNVTVSYPLKKEGSSVKYNLSLDTSDRGPDVEDDWDKIPTLHAVDEARRATVTSTVDLGGIKVGDKFNDQMIQFILTRLLSPTVPPKLLSSVDSNLALYGKSNSINVSVKAERGSVNLSKIFVNDNVTEAPSGILAANFTQAVNITPMDASIDHSEIEVSATDVKGNRVYASQTIKHVGGVFLFFSDLEELPAGFTLDFTEHNCQSPRLTPDGTYSIYHDGLEYFYLVTPDTYEMDLGEISAGCPIPMSYLGVHTSIYQKDVLLNMRVYRSREKFNPGTFSCIIKSKLNI